MHPIHYDLGFFAGWKVVVIVLWLPIAAVLTLIFDPQLDPRPQQIVVFFVAIWGAYLIRSFLLWMLGMVTFWTTRVERAVRALLRRRAAAVRAACSPLDLMPEWAQDLATFLPFQWTFGYPITALVGPISDRDLYLGLSGPGRLDRRRRASASRWMWRRAVRRYTAVAG